MLNLKYILAAGTALLIPNSVFADTCASLPSCESLGFEFSASDCGTLKKLKCPFANDKFFCSKANCKAVSLNQKLERCTKKCAEDANICIEKEDLPCITAISNMGGTRYTDGQSISGKHNNDMYLMGTVTQATGSNIQSLSLEGTGTSGSLNIYDAGERIPACKKEMAGKTASLKLAYPNVNGSINFYVPTTITNMSFSSSNSASLSFYKNSKINMKKTVYNPTYYQQGSISLHFGGGTTATHEAYITCYYDTFHDNSSYSSSYVAPCHVSTIVPDYNNTTVSICMSASNKGFCSKPNENPNSMSSCIGYAGISCSYGGSGYYGAEVPKSQGKCTLKGLPGDYTSYCYPNTSGW